MLIHYLKIAYRNLLRNRTYSAINIAGLSVGIACFLVIALYVGHELSFDRFHSKSDRIYRVSQVVDELMSTTSESIMNAGLPSVSVPLAPLLEEQFGEIEHTARLYGEGDERIVGYGENSFKETNIYYVGPGLFNVFDIDVLSGEPSSALSQPGTVFIAESVAYKYFKEENPVGKTLLIDNEEQFEVVGVFRDLPDNSHIRLNLLFSFESLSEEIKSSWIHHLVTYISVEEGTDADRLKSDLQSLVQTMPEGTFAPGTAGFSLVPLHDLHLRSREHLAVPLRGQGDIRYIYLFSAIGVVILLIAGINFVNLTTARASMRAREVGVRKATGAFRSQLVMQFIAESILVIGVATLCGILLAELALPGVNDFLGSRLALSGGGGVFWFLLTAAVTILAIGAGGYTALVLSRFSPVRVIKGDLGVASWNTLRKGLVVFQFGISAILMIATLVMFFQLQFLQNKNLGFNADQVVTVPLQGALDGRAESFKAELLENAGIGSVTLTSGTPGNPYGILIASPDEIEGFAGEESYLALNYFEVDEDFQQTYQTEMAAGRMFSSALGSDASEAVVINEAAARKIGWEDDAIGKVLNLRGERRVIGVVRDFHFSSMKADIEPMVLMPNSVPPGYATMRIGTENIQEALDIVRASWDRFAPAYPFSYSFMDDTFEQMYRSEQNLGYLFGIFTTLAICIAALGLFGLASYITQKRMQEIGIRKVLGADTRHILVLLSRDFVVLIAISFAVAIPVTWYYMNQWLTNFSYRIDLGFEIYLLAALLSLGIVVLSVGWQTIRALSLRPVVILRKE